MIKAVIFDFFGVLGMRGLRLFKQKHLDRDEVKRKQAKELQNQLDSGEVSYDDFIDRLAEIGGTDRKTVLQYTEDYKPNTELLEYIRSTLKPKYKLGIISNSGADWVTRIIGEENKGLFDDVILSYQSGFIKPDSEIYEMSARNLGVNPGHCVFVDDISTYCQGAEAVGMKTIWYRDFEQFKTDMEELLSAVADN